MADRHQSQAYPLRLPDELKAKVAEAAGDTGRSLNAEIVSRLQSTFSGHSEALATQARDLERELLKSTLEVNTQRNNARLHAVVLLTLAKRIPAGAFSDQPFVEEALQKFRGDETAVMQDMVQSMLDDARSAMSGIHRNIKSGALRVLSSDGSVIPPEQVVTTNFDVVLDRAIANTSGPAAPESKGPPKRRMNLKKKG